MSRLIGVALGVCVLTAGCCGTRRCNHVAERPCAPGGCGCNPGGPLPPRFAPLPAAPPGAPAPAPAWTPPAPPAAALGTPVPSNPPAPPAPMPPAPAEESARLPDIRLGPPGPLRTPEAPGERREARSLPPQTREPPVASVPNKPPPKAKEDRPPPPAVKEDRDPPLPIDLPGFAIARPGVASGLKPFPDGIVWLKRSGYRTVLHLRQPGEDTTAVRRQLEASGLRYLSLVASPARMDARLLQQFNAAVTDRRNQPLYVFDRDGSMAGALWYLHHRIHLKLSDEKARAEAVRLGLRLDDDAEHKTALLAAQALLGKLLKAP